MNTIYKIGETELILEEVVAIEPISRMYTNEFAIPIYLKGGSKLLVRYKALEDEIVKEGLPSNHFFTKRCDYDFRILKMTWKKCLTPKF